MNIRTHDRSLRLLAAVGLGLGGLLGMAGSFAPSAALRGLAWGIDGVSLVVASALLMVHFFRRGEDFVAAGYLVFSIGQGLIVSGAAMNLEASAPSFGAGASLWSAALVLVSVGVSLFILSSLFRLLKVHERIANALERNLTRRDENTP